MSNATSGAQRSQAHAERLAWLKRHPDLLAKLPGANAILDDEERLTLAHVQLLMTQHGLYAATSEPKATRWGIRLLVSELRGEHASKDQRFKS